MVVWHTADPALKIYKFTKTSRHRSHIIVSVFPCKLLRNTIIPYFPNRQNWKSFHIVINIIYSAYLQIKNNFLYTKYLLCTYIHICIYVNYLYSFIRTDIFIKFNHELILCGNIFFFFWRRVKFILLDNIKMYACIVFALPLKHIFYMKK